MIPAEPVHENEAVHQLKNHLGLILTYCELLLESADGTDQQRQDVAMIRQAANDALLLVPRLPRPRP